MSTRQYSDIGAFGTLQVALLKGFAEGTEARIITNIAQGLANNGLRVDKLEGDGKLFRISLLSAIARNDALIVHSPLVYSLLYVLFARMIGKPIVGLVWDHYPVTLEGKRYDSSLRRRFLDWAENLTIALCTHILVPSEDFLASPNLSRADVVPFWFSVGRGLEESPTPQRPDLRVIFAGQINATRGLEAAFAELEAHFGDEFVLSVASRDPLPHDLAGKKNVEYLGFLQREELQAELAKCSVGLVALAHGFDGPGLPSKTWEYLSAGLPVIFIGKALPHYAEALRSSGVGFVLTPATRGTISMGQISGACLTVSEISQFSAYFELDSDYLFSRLISVLQNHARLRREI